MTEMISVPKADYDALLGRLQDLEDLVAALEAAGDVTLPHEVAVPIMNGTHPVRAWREYRGQSLRAVAEASGLSASYLSEIETGAKTGTVDTYQSLARVLDTSVEALLP
ncbi:helix-turn-helix transcriptional regulator [Caenispirillum bisanense]|uniref:helix-turn-helix domain-containing protein n=1 Tax=Caenispirillum bisanense TaxID=414052 RepID=UPI0031DF6623